MSIFKEYQDYDGIGLANLIKSKEISPVDALDTAIDLIERLNPSLNAVHQKLYHYATESISRQKDLSGVFACVPMLLKDMDSSLSTVPMMQGSKYLKNTKMNFNNSLSKKFINTGALICGKSATPEFGLMVTTEPTEFGPTKNPWDKNRSTGGSSGGSASAVASRMVPFGHASDGGGSIRIPAASCGTIGLKPTRGRISFSPSHGDKWGGLTHSGIVSRSVRDTAYMYDEIFGSEIGDPYSVQYEKGTLIRSLTKKSKYKIGFNYNSRIPVDISNDARNAVLHNAKLCEDLGHSVEEIKIDYDGLLLSRAFVIIISSHVTQMFIELKEIVGKSFKNNEIENGSRMFNYLGKNFRGSDYAWARQTIQKISRDVMLQTNEYDVVIMPIISQIAPLLGELRPNKSAVTINEIIMKLRLGILFRIPSIRDSILNKLAPESLWFAPDAILQNVTGQPSISVPTYFTESNMPLGVQFVGRYAEEEVLIDLAAQLETASPWINKKPNLD
jgi:amidase|tara:strand:+ start:789 stop:2294 length:1506 start_codon:yes stop_codon:yes gene_type:complete